MGHVLGGDADVVRGESSAEAAAHGAPLEVLHLDMDAFFASVEMRADPALAGRPVVVGGTGVRGVVASASYEARRYGIRSAMPMGEARRRCPQLVAVAARHGVYGEVSGELMLVLRSVTPLVEPVALDEAYLDVSGAHRAFGPSGEIAAALRAQVRERLQLSCAVGVGRTKLIAKLASKAAKPEPAAVPPRHAGVLVIEASDEPAFLRAQPLRALPGIGPRSAERLARVGVATVADLQQLERGQLVRLLGGAHGAVVHDLAHGRDPRRVEPDRPTRSIGHEETFARDLRDGDELATRAKAMAVGVAARCRESGVVGRTVAVKVRYGDFRTVTRARTVSHALRAAGEIGAIAAALLAELPLERGVRLLGVQVSGLLPAEEAPGDQLSLFDAGISPKTAERAAPVDWARRAEAEAAADEVRRRYGADAISLPGAAPAPIADRRPR